MMTRVCREFRWLRGRRRMNDTRWWVERERSPRRPKSCRPGAALMSAEGQRGNMRYAVAKLLHRGYNRDAPNHWRVVMQSVQETRRGSRGMNRRDLLRAGCLSAVGLPFADMLNPPAQATSAAALDRTFGRAKNLLFLFLAGGPSQYETFARGSCRDSRHLSTDRQQCKWRAHLRIVATHGRHR